MLYGSFTAVVANLTFTVMATFADEIRSSQSINMSEILAANLSLSSSFGILVTSVAAPLTMAAFGYSAQAASQSTSALEGIKALYIFCTAMGLALSGVVLYLFRKS
jgi:Na+/melibiose symporter-like transporter